MRASAAAVAIGTSAGGIEALGVLLPALPASFPAPVLVVIHLPGGRPSLLTEIFAPRCALPVREAEDKLPCDPGTVWFAPPDYHLLVDRGPQLALSTDPHVHFSRPSIDVLFDSAADVWREALLAIVLTGGNDDGAAGLAAVRRAGGRVVVQDPAEAAMPAMPLAALDRCPDATVLPLAGIAALLADLARESRP
jgi:two-component system chemotaxis response regulator CheB